MARLSKWKRTSHQVYETDLPSAFNGQPGILHVRIIYMEDAERDRWWSWYTFNDRVISNPGDTDPARTLRDAKATADAAARCGFTLHKKWGWVAGHPSSYRREDVSKFITE